MAPKSRLKTRVQLGTLRRRLLMTKDQHARVTHHPPRFLTLTLFAFSTVGCSSEEEPSDSDAADASDASDASDPSDAADASDPADPSDTSSSNCDDTEGFQNRIAELQNAFDTITENVGEYPIGVTLPEATNGTLEITLNPNAFPLILDDRGVFAAASKLGEGRVVAFSGQDFISSQDRSTLLGVGDVNTLLKMQRDGPPD